MGYVEQRLSREIEPGGNERGKGGGGGGGGGRSFKRNNKCGRVQRRKNKKKDARFRKRIECNIDGVVNRTIKLESLVKSEVTAGAVDEVNDDGGVVVNARNDRVRHVVWNDIALRHLINRVEIIRKTSLRR